MAGERYRPWEPEPGRGRRPVCGLCESEAVRAGWVRTQVEPERERADALRFTVRLVA